MSAATKLVNQPLGRCLRPIKSLVSPLVCRLIDYLAARLCEPLAARLDEFPSIQRLDESLNDLRSRQEKLDAYRWDHLALARRLAALEDQVERLSRHSASTQTASPAPGLPLVDLESHGSRAEDRERICRLERAG